VTDAAEMFKRRTPARNANAQAFVEAMHCYGGPSVVIIIYATLQKHPTSIVILATCADIAYIY
jgi:hypothetical protein